MRSPVLWLSFAWAVVWILVVIVAWHGADVAVIVALVGFAGTVTGAVITAVTQLVQASVAERKRSATDDVRKALLSRMLDCDGWRELTTLMHGIGADEETTKRLLLERGARASETGKPIWALVSRKPLPAFRKGQDDD